MSLFCVSVDRRRRHAPTETISSPAVTGNGSLIAACIGVSALLDLWEWGWAAGSPHHRCKQGLSLLTFGLAASGLAVASGFEAPHPMPHTKDCCGRTHTPHTRCGPSRPATCLGTWLLLFLSALTRGGDARSQLHPNSSRMPAMTMRSTLVAKPVVAAKRTVAARPQRMVTKAGYIGCPTNRTLPDLSR